jgi:predicted nuclease of predicted toxin-antitoxin system
MNFLADECLDRSIVEQLRLDGHTVGWIAESAPSISDDEILQQARASDSILLTDDKDFGDLVYRDGRSHSGVILTRLEGVPNAAKASIVSSVVRDHADELVGAFTVVSANSVRIRRPPTDVEPGSP